MLPCRLISAHIPVLKTRSKVYQLIIIQVLLCSLVDDFLDFCDLQYEKMVLYGKADRLRKPVLYSFHCFLRQCHYSYNFLLRVVLPSSVSNFRCLKRSCCWHVRLSRNLNLLPSHWYYVMIHHEMTLLSSVDGRECLKMYLVKHAIMPKSDIGYFLETCWLHWFACMTDNADVIFPMCLVDALIPCRPESLPEI